MKEDNKDNKDKHPYDDIIDLPHPISYTHVQMSIHDRAAQFSPFAALTGFNGAIKETARLTDQKIELDETEKTILDEKLGMIREQLSKPLDVEFTFFQQDERKEGGTYLSIVGRVKRMDAYIRAVIMEDGTRIPIEDIVDINIGDKE
ncbi:MAG TPA: hypothetical protein VJZ04_03125 [Lachnospiraceae bacterium]|nr:hypothetical protein [Lachnospiraceae bacterium]